MWAGDGSSASWWGSSSWSAHDQLQGSEGSSSEPLKGRGNVQTPDAACEDSAVQPARVNVVAGAGLQPAGGARGPLVPEGIGPKGFIDAMLSVAHPMEAPPALPKTAEAAYDQQSVNANSLVKRRWKVLARIEAWAREMAADREKWAQSLHPDVREVIGHLRGPLLEKLVKKSGADDSTGVIVFQISKFNIHTPPGAPPGPSLGPSWGSRGPLPGLQMRP